MQYFNDTTKNGDQKVTKCFFQFVHFSISMNSKMSFGK